LKLKLLRSVLLKNKRRSVSIGKNYLGRIGISLSTLESLAKRKVMQIPEIKKVNIKAETLAHLAVRFSVDISVREKKPSLSEIIEITIKEEICSLTGFKQHNIEVVLNNVTVDKSRVK